MSFLNIPCNPSCTKETGRTITCKFDGTCNKYQVWKEEHERQKAEVNKKKQKEYDSLSELLTNKGKRISKRSTINNINGTM